jgi:HK97 family phage prohead protease
MSHPIETRDPLADIEPEVRPVQMVNVRAADESPGTVEFIAQFYGTVNDYNEIFVPGCFAKSISERVPRGRVKVTDGHRWSCQTTLGTVREAKDVVSPQPGLWMKAELSSVEEDIRTKLREGHIQDCSIEFRSINAGPEVVDGESRYLVREAILFGVSFLPYSSQDIPAVLSVRSAGRYQALPLAPAATPWKPEEALMRVTSWATGDVANGGINFARLGRAFLRQAQAGEVSGYSLQVADLVGHKLMAVPAAVVRAAGDLVRQRAAMPAADYEAARAHLDRYFERMRSDLGMEVRAPWDRAAAIDLALAAIDDAGQVPAEHVTDVRNVASILVRALPAESRTALLEELSAGPATAPPTTEASEDDIALRMRRSRDLELELSLME